MTPNLACFAACRRRRPSEGRRRAQRAPRTGLRILASLCAIGSSLAGAAVSAPACRVPGTPMHWIADYCMATLGTDDEIAASGCIDRERAVAFASACSAKIHYKRAMCELAVQRDAWPGSVASCVADSTFVGPTVRNGGVGGQPRPSVR